MTSNPPHSSPDPYHNCSKRTRLTANNGILPLSEQEMLENSSYIINTYVTMTNDEMKLWQQSVITKCLHENKVNYLLDQLKSIDPTDFSYPATRFYHSNAVLGRTRSLSFEDCAISMAIDNCGLQQTSGSDIVLDSIRNDSAELNAPIEVIGAPEPIDHSNFIEAAVAVAIQEKGLSPSNIQVSPNR